MKRRGQLKRRVQRRGPFASERPPLALVKGDVSNRFVLQTVCLATLFALDFAPARAEDATWSPPTAVQDDFNDPGNWTPIGVPTGTAFFGPSNQDFPLIEADTELNQIQFTNLAPSSYTIGVGFVGPATLT